MFLHREFVLQDQAFNFILKGAQHFSFGKGHFYQENLSLYQKIAKFTTAKAPRYKVMWVQWVILRPVQYNVFARLRNNVLDR